VQKINLQPQEPLEGQVAFYQLAKWPVWGLAFRSFFLGGAAVAVLGILVWQLWLSGILTWNTPWPPALWHAHEMLFGFAACVAVGFLLTAAQTWTGVSSLSGGSLALMFSFWLGARLLFFSAETTTDLLAGVVFQLNWWLMGIGAMARMLWLSRNRRNYLFLPLLVVMMLAELVILVPLFSKFAFDLGFSLHLSQSLVLMFTLLMGIVGGRVIPFFTLNALKRKTANATLQQIPTPGLDKALLLFSILGTALFIASYYWQQLQPGWLMVLLAILHFARWCYWHGRKTLFEPLLWSLHISYLMMSLGLALMGLSLLGMAIVFKDALHLVTLGAIGGMILAMMARVSLGHTGRQLKAKKIISVAFLLLFSGALFRAFSALWLGYHYAWLLSSLFWLLSFSLFFVVYFPVLTRRRIDGRPG